MFNSIKSYFKVLTNDELEINEFRERQAAGRRRREAVERKVEVHNITVEVVSLVESDDEYIGTVDSVAQAFQQLVEMQNLPRVVSSNVETIRKPSRSYAQRPHNWEDIADHFITILMMMMIIMK